MAPSALGESSSRLNKSGRVRLQKHCTRCTSTGRTCDGYGGHAIRPSIQSPHVVQMPSAWGQVSGNAVEIKNFAFFRLVTTTDLAGFFDVGFWTGKLIQLAHQYPFITDRTPTTVTRVGDTPNMRSALVHFNKPIQSLRKLLSGPTLARLDKLVALSTCLLFTCMVSLPGRQWQAFMHIDSGLKMVHYWNLGVRDRIESDHDLDLDLLILHFNKMMRLLLSKDLSDPTFISKSLVKKQKCIDDFQQRDARLSCFLSTTVPSETNDQALNLLHIRRIFAGVFLSLDSSTGELCHDDFIPDYRQMLGLAISLLDELKLAPTGKAGRLTSQYCLATTVAEPLFLIAARCRKATIRICEGLVAAKLAETMLEGRKGGRQDSCTTGQWVCGNHRLAVLHFVLIAERQIKILIRTVEDSVCGRGERVFVTSYW
ncbi:uncharacterized protein BP01DRAFT_413933 [Aspergillus saccharolyticus JOP 1030-1]|uniref:Zn(2)-C6 fungal-type domain-containing protein n=1 Tax=Aspergillus saccharolyticus JOP 1030-1 TaxID=1450539 RepID=A0A318ZKV5_9EURO|nr:hypothetical protein BP01DRAFT_413933 [Aspergillus saccharolyticus JOP 1030-1]PYH48231.1 hypothetical protein BP01DRAFT_413933 [Aspergillus saccharolyticus JOP 1030-1]